MMSKYIIIFGFIFICLLNLHFQSLEAQVQSTVDPFINDSLIEVPATFSAIQNPQTGQLEVKNWTIRDISPQTTNTDTSTISPEDLSNFASNCDAVLSNENLFNTNYVILGKISNSTIISNKNVSTVSFDLHDVRNSGSDKIILFQSEDGLEIEPKLVNIVCEYGNSVSNNASLFTPTAKYVSFLSDRCSDKFEDTIYRLKGEFNNPLNLTFMSSLENTNPNIKIALKKGIDSKISGYISNYRIGEENIAPSELGTFTINSISISCSLLPMQ